MNDKKDWETEQGEEHEIMWWIIRKTEKYEEGENTKSYDQWKERLRNWTSRRTRNNVINDKND